MMFPVGDRGGLCTVQYGKDNVFLQDRVQVDLLDKIFRFLGSLFLNCDSIPLRAQQPPGLLGITYGAGGTGG